MVWEEWWTGLPVAAIPVFALQTSMDPAVPLVLLGSWSLLPSLGEARAFLQQECWVTVTKLGGSSQASFPLFHVFLVHSFTAGHCLVFLTPSTVQTFTRLHVPLPMQGSLAEWRLKRQTVWVCVWAAFIRELLSLITGLSSKLSVKVCERREFYFRLNFERQGWTIVTNRTMDDLHDVMVVSSIIACSCKCSK